MSFPIRRGGVFDVSRVGWHDKDPRSARARRLAARCAIVASLHLVSTPAGAAHVFAVRGDVKIGSFAVRADGSLAGAIRAFGSPSSRRHTYGAGTCTVAWIRHGLTINFYNLGGADACSADGGRFSRASCAAGTG